jgi:Ca2+-binding RTX toxin-like protein
MLGSARTARTRLAVAVCAAVVLAGLAGAASASAAVSCTFAAGTATIGLPANGDAATLSQTAAGAITVNGAACGAATRANTTSVLVDGALGSQSLTVSLANNNFNNPTGTEPLINARLGSGSDTIQVDGAAAADNIRFGTLGANFNADSDLDLVSSSVENFTFRGLLGNDVLSGNGGAGTGSPTTKGNVHWLGGAGGDTLTGGDGPDDLAGDADLAGGGAVAGGGNDVISGGTGSDTLSGHVGDDSLTGGDGNDQMRLDIGNDTYSAGDGQDTFSPETGQSLNPDGSDRISGGAGADFISLSGRTQNLVITLDNKAATAPAVGNDGADTNADGVADEGDDIRADVENIATGGGNDTVNADTSLANAAFAANQLSLGGGNDTGKGGEGIDSLDGAGGDDTLTGGPANDGVTGGPGHDTLTGDAGNDTVSGGADSDPKIDGGTGDDFLPQEFTVDGPDVVTGGTGRDSVTIQRSSNIRITLDNVANDGSDLDQDGSATDDEADNFRSDIESITTGTGNDLIDANTSQANAAGAENQLFGGTGNDVVRGGTGDDTLDSGSGDDTLVGGAGEDQMLGGAGKDTFSALDGYFDRLNGGFGDGVNDVVTADPFDERTDLP